MTLCFINSHTCFYIYSTKALNTSFRDNNTNLDLTRSNYEDNKYTGFNSQVGDHLENGFITGLLMR
eukprot:Pgem_evm1s2195